MYKGLPSSVILYKTNLYSIIVIKFKHYTGCFKSQDVANQLFSLPHHVN